MYSVISGVIQSKVRNAQREAEIVCATSADSDDGVMRCVVGLLHEERGNMGGAVVLLLYTNMWIY